jgi:hypothetical protein
MTDLGLGGAWVRGVSLTLCPFWDCPVERYHDAKNQGKTYRKMVPSNTLPLLQFNSKKSYSPYSPYSPSEL